LKASQREEIEKTSDWRIRWTHRTHWTRYRSWHNTAQTALSDASIWSTRSRL